MHDTFVGIDLWRPSGISPDSIVESYLQEMMTGEVVKRLQGMTFRSFC